MRLCGKVTSVGNAQSVVEKVVDHYIPSIMGKLEVLPLLLTLPASSVHMLRKA